MAWTLILILERTTLPAASRVKDETISASAWVPAEGLPAATVEVTESQLVPEKLAESAKLFSCIWSAAISDWILSLFSALAPTAATSLTLIWSTLSMTLFMAV